MNNDCANWYETIWLWLEGDLEELEVGRLEAHLQVCTDCRREVARQRQLTQLLTVTPMATPSPGFSDRFQHRLSARRSRKKSWAGIGLLTLTGIAVLAALAATCAFSAIDWWQILPVANLLNMGMKITIVLGESAASLFRVVLLVGKGWVTALNQPVLVFHATLTATLCALWAIAVNKRADRLVPARVDVQWRHE